MHFFKNQYFWLFLLDTFKNRQQTVQYYDDDNYYYEKIGKNEPVKLEDLPFDIPDNWTWIRLINISQYGMGQTMLTKDMNDSGIPIYSATISDEPLGFISSSINKIKLSFGDLVVPARGNSIGHVTFIKDNEASCTQTTLSILSL